MKILITNEAKSAMEDIYKYASHISSQYAKRIINSIYETIYDLQDTPYIGRYVPELSDKQFRERICGNYRIIYYLSEKTHTIYIRYILCVKQNSNLFFKIHKKELFRFFDQFFS